MMSGIPEHSAQLIIATHSGPAEMRHLENGEPGAVEGVLLVMTCWCTVLASGLLSPVLPQIAHRFAYLPHIELLVGLVATMPALVVSLSAVPMGWLADRLGHRKVLFGALLLYGIAGVVPFSLQGIWAIIGTRAIVGLGEAGAMITGTALIGLRFRGARRGRWLAAQIATSNILGIFALQLGGFLGLLDWHTPFLAYSFALLLLAPSLYFVRSPDDFAESTANANLPSTPSNSAVKATAILCGMEVIGIFAMFTIIIQMAFLFQQRGAVNSADIGIGISCGAFGLATGATSSGALARIDWLWRTMIGFMLAGAGFLSVAFVSGYWATGATLALAGLGVGLTVPALLNALVAVVPHHVLGRAIGFWTAATFIPQFLNPPTFILLRHMVGTQSRAIGVIGILLLALGLFLAISGKVVRRHTVATVTASS
jgi:predicted MFS family arabinose efflux permease